MAKGKNQGTQGNAQGTQGTQTPPPASTGAAPVNAAMQVVYKLGKAYNVRQGTAQANDRSWAAIQAVIQANGGQATRAELHAAVAPFNHAPMVGYCIRRGWLTPVQPAAPSTQAA